MILKRFPVGLAGLLAIAPVMVAAAGGPVPQIMVESKTITLDPIADQTRGATKWSHGAFLFQTVGAGLPPTFYTLDREGRLIFSVTASIPDAGYVSAGHFERRDDNSIVFLGQAGRRTARRLRSSG